jgi:hypothetical protein
MLRFRGIGQTFCGVMAGLVHAIPVGQAAPFPIEMAGESSPHAASVFFVKDGRARRAHGPAMTQSSGPPNLFRSKPSVL